MTSNYLSEGRACVILLVIFWAILGTITGLLGVAKEVRELDAMEEER